jgi:hypothetical protein
LENIVDSDSARLHYALILSGCWMPRPETQFFRESSKAMKTSTDAKLGVGLLGCGAFCRFCLLEFGAMPGEVALALCCGYQTAVGRVLRRAIFAVWLRAIFLGTMHHPARFAVPRYCPAPDKKASELKRGLELLA